MTPARKRILFRVAAIAWAIGIFALSSIHSSDLPPGRYSTIGHFVLYVVLATLVYASLDGAPRQRAIVAIALTSAYGITDELHQLFVPGRCADPVDWLVDTAGAVAAMLVALSVVRVRQRKQND